MTIKYRKNPAFERELKAQPEFQTGMRRITLSLAVIIKDGAPRGHHPGGAFRRSLSAKGTSVVTTDAFWHLIENGSVNNPPYAPFRRGILTAGMRFIPH